MKSSVKSLHLFSALARSYSWEWRDIHCDLPVQHGKTVWLSKVTDQEYGSSASTALTATTSSLEEEILELPKEKWTWMADKNIDKLEDLFNEKSAPFIWAAWGKEQELNIITKKADVHEASIQIIGNTAIVLNKMTLIAVVGGNEVQTLL